jgi:sec-independent protein translocase protein TatB
VFGIGIEELIVLAVLGVIMFGPEKMPEMARKAARVVHYLQGIANNAQSQLREELGPEYADLQLTDLTPKALIQKHLIDGIQDELDELKGDLSEIKLDLKGEADSLKEVGRSTAHELDAAASDIKENLGEVKRSASDAKPEAKVLAFAQAAPYDPDAT